MFENTWNRIVGWFTNINERAKLVREFNKSAQEAFVLQTVPTLLKSSISKGNSAYRHQFSHWLNSGFRIIAFEGRQLSKAEIIFIGNVVLSDTTLVRKLVVLGWDTLEVTSDAGIYGCQWQLKDFIALN